MMFGFGNKGTTNLITQCLEAVGKKLETVPDPTQVRSREVVGTNSPWWSDNKVSWSLKPLISMQVHYHLPKSEWFPEVSPFVP